MALVTPLLLMMLFGIIDFGRMLNAQITLTEAAREGARAVALGYPAEDQVAGATTGLRPGPSTQVISGCGDEADGSDPAPDDAIVTVSHSFRAVTPLGALTRMFGGTEDGSLTITARGVMPCLGSG